MNDLNGVYPAVVTPFRSDGRFDPGAFERLLDWLYAGGVHGIYLGGTTGEGTSQSMRQRKEVLEATIRSSPGGKRVIAHVGASSLDDTVELAAHAGAAGATAISSLPPPGLYSFQEIRDFYEALAQAAEVPLLLYYFPELSSAISSLEQLLELSELENVAGLKFTDFDLYKLSELRREGHVVFNGRDEVLAAGLLMGASGGIGTFYNLMPEEFVRLYRCACEGRWEETRAIQREVNVVIRTTIQYPIFPAIKAILSWMDLDCGECLPPRRTLTSRQAEELHAKLLDTCLRPALVRHRLVAR